MVAVIPRDLFAVSVPKGEQSKVKTRIEMKKQVEAPLTAGQVVGEIVALMEEKEIARMPLVAAAAVEKASLWQTITYHMKSVFTLK